MAVTNPTGSPVSVDPEASAGLIPLNSAPDAVPAHSTVSHDYAVPADKFGGSYAYPSSGAIVAAGGFDQHFAHMRAYWNASLAGIAQIVRLPDMSLINAYKTGFIYTQIIRSGDELKTGANRYDKQFSHDVIGIWPTCSPRDTRPTRTRCLTGPGTSAATSPITWTGCGPTPGCGPFTCSRPAT